MSVKEEPEDGDGSTIFKKEFFTNLFNAQKELSKKQREYKKVISMRLKTRSQQIVEKSYVNTITRLKAERNDLRAQIWVANGKQHIAENAHNLKMIRCHIKCQVQLNNKIQKYKTDIDNLERNINFIDKEVYDLNQKTVPDAQHQEYVKRARKKMALLENRLEIGTWRECGFTMANETLRDEVKFLIKQRAFFNHWYLKLIDTLNNDVKYQFELIKYATSTFDDCINFQEKLNNLRLKSIKEDENLRGEMQSLIRKSAEADSVIPFIQSKNQYRPLAPISSKERRRREKFRHEHERKIALYSHVLDKIHKYTLGENSKHKSIHMVIETFQQQESIYYSYCSMANEMSFHITLLNNSVNQLQNNIRVLKDTNHNKNHEQVETINSLIKILNDKRINNDQLQAKLQTKYRHLDTLCEGFTNIVNACNCNTTPLSELLGDHEEVNLFNIKDFCKILEKRVVNIVAAVFIAEQHDSTKSYENYVVRKTYKCDSNKTPLEDIVLAQQCPECAEGEAVNIDEVGGDSIKVHTEEDTKRILFEKVNQPEMQYRLHAINDCRLPRSRILAAKMLG